MGSTATGKRFSGEREEEVDSRGNELYKVHNVEVAVDGDTLKFKTRRDRREICLFTGRTAKSRAFPTVAPRANRCGAFYIQTPNDAIK